MNTPSLFSRGSEWRKWDLHIHTPLSVVQNYGGDTEDVWEKFIQDLENLPKEFTTIGINDYLFIDGYEKVLAFKKQGRLENIKLILPVLEFRLKHFAGTEGKLKKINFHVIFSDKIEPKTIQSQFISALSSKCHLSPEANRASWSGVIDRDSISDFGRKIKSSIPQDKIYEYGTDLVEGFNNLVFEEDSILGILEKSTYFNENDSPLYLTAVGKTEWESLRWNDNSIASKKDIINKVDFVFISSETVEQYENAKNKLKENSVNDLLLDCSDAHSFSDRKITDDNGKERKEKDRIGKCFTWIKADPIFEGLKYLIYDPKERVCIEQNNPDSLFPKPYFSKINIQDAHIFQNLRDTQLKFTNTNLKLNAGLIAIIGGRGTGKSILLDAIATTFNMEPNEDRSEKISMQEGNFSVEYTKNNSEETINFDISCDDTISYLHVHQRKVSYVVRNLELLSKEIEQMLGIYNLENNVSKYEEDIEDILEQIKKNKEFINQDSIDNSQLIINNRTQLISTITTNKNRQKIESYANNIAFIRDKEEHINKLSSLRSKLDKLIIEVNDEISSINNGETESSIPTIDFSPQLKSIEETTFSLRNIIDSLMLANQQVQKELEEENIEGDPITLLQKVDEHRSEIENEKQKILQIQEKETELKSLLQKRHNFVNQLDEKLNKSVSNINQKWSEKQSENQNNWTSEQQELIENILKPIRIYGDIYFDNDKFYRELMSFLNLKKFQLKKSTKPSSDEAKNLERVKIVKKAINVNDYETYKKLIRNEPIIQLDDMDNPVPITLEDFLAKEEYFNKDGDDKLLNMLFSESERQNYLKVIARVEYHGKSPDALSVGQRGTLYLCLKLATESFFNPIIIDQPEDDLDNEFIMEHLVPIFKTIKKYRQIIIATHNANLVVNADAEQVIVADNKSENLSYFSGSLENPQIREKICDVLEGGKEAFKKRVQKYGFV